MILYDYQTFLNQKYGGISLYYSKLISNLINNGVNCKLGLDNCENFSFNEELKNIDCLPSEFTTPNLNNWLFGKSFPGKGRIYKALFGNLAYQSNFDLQSKKKICKLKR
jgi:hypothetical protein